MLNSELLKKVEEYVRKIYENKANEEMIYHNISHTLEVLKTAEEIARAENLTQNDLEVLLIAAWFHDVGHLDICYGHEEVGSSLAKEFLKKENYPAEKVDKVIKCILATKVPQTPQSLVEKVLCDADLHHLGLPDVDEKGQLLRLELQNRNIKHYTDLEWYETTVKFLKSHRFHTNYAKQNYEFQKNINLIKLEKKHKKLEKKQKDDQIKDLKLEIEKKKFDSKSTEARRSDRGIETMFRNIMRTHVEFSAMADSKANIMISVNTIMITFIVSFLLRFLEENNQFIIPAAALTLTSLITLIYAILVTRPKISEGLFTKDDILQKKSNLLFFGNFYKMKIDDFTWGMKTLMDDREYLYDSMIKDFYNLGQVLGIKYKHLRICYNIFMYGLIVSILLFAIALIAHPSYNM